jgi:HSP20 family protein
VHAAGGGTWAPFARGLAGSQDRRRRRRRRRGEEKHRDPARSTTGDRPPGRVGAVAGAGGSVRPDGRLARESFGELGYGRWSPGLDLEETDDAYVAELDVPGVKKDDLEVEVSGNRVRVHGEVKDRQRTGLLHRQTRRVGVFDYAFTVPSEVDADRIEASLGDGVLTIRAPKMEAARPRRIQISPA